MNTRDGGDEGQSSDKKQEEDGDGENDHGKQRSQPTRSSFTSLATDSTLFFNLVDASQATSPCFSARSWMRASQEGILLNGGTRVFTTSKAEPR